MPYHYLLLFSLYWAQGLPVGFMTHALPVVLRAQGVSLAHIGGFGLLMAPWAIKILWAPLVDRYGHHQAGHYRSWIIPTQILTIVILVILSFLPIQSLNEPRFLFLFFIALLCMNSIGATQDIATDGLAVRILKEEQQHFGNMFQVIGSRLGFIVGGGAILWAMDWLSWQMTFLILAAIVACNTLPIWFYQEPEHLRIASKKTSHQTNIDRFEWFRGYLRYFFENKELTAWFFLLCTIKVTDGFAGPITKPLLVDLKLSLSQIGIYITMLGAFSALFGAGLAGLLLKKIKRHQALLLFYVLKLISLAGFVWLAVLYEQAVPIAPWIIYLINALEDMFAAMLLVVILTLVMQYSRSEYAGTDFTFQVSIMASISGVLYTVSGMIGDQLGYLKFLSLILLVGMFCLIPIIYWMRNMYEK
ncbi:MFS transporter [Acinetobacter bereziniae]|uniref:MFS transporter n=1 Tax=Acinetobacter bereziniae TaxID=106648 RepID=UPI0012504892|nr:MFS transporter [Acinetobacter bereziniae]MBJ9902169.1 MFS transporter [Acinetobacter bereziniae]MCU4318278.1 MFS transporter [Acinetobacter bereziniae]MCU4600868.1 MFS transporter [Acinetobacter bereziniae]